jgi:aminoglycoside 6'-N-acetyltransferase
MGLVSFRALERSDFPLLQKWLSEPHINEWWHQRLDMSGLERKYGPRIDGIVPVHVFMIEHEAKPIGWIQWYRWSDYPDHAAQLDVVPEAAGIDLSIGELPFVGKGIGPIAIREFVFNVICIESGVTAVASDPEENNSRSCRAFEKAGFIRLRTVRVRGEKVWRRVMQLSLPSHHATAAV